jgi:hypothetical protein
MDVDPPYTKGPPLGRSLSTLCVCELWLALCPETAMGRSRHPATHVPVAGHTARLMTGGSVAAFWR